MKKIFLLCSIILCYASSYASITLSASPSSVQTTTPGGTTFPTILVTASGETSASHITSVTAVVVMASSPASSYFGGSFSGVNLYNPTSGTPTSLTLQPTTTSTLNQSYIVAYKFTVTTNDGSITSLVVGPMLYEQPWWNVAESGNFTRTGCGAGSTGSTVTYTIPAHSYSSYISQTDANNQAIAAVNSGGQAYANANGVCCAAPAITATYIDGVLYTGGTISTGSHTLHITFSNTPSYTIFTAISGCTLYGQGYSSTDGYCSFNKTSSAQIKVAFTTTCSTTNTTVYIN